MSSITEIVAKIERTLKALEVKHFGNHVMLPKDYELAKELEEKRIKDLEARKHLRDEKRRYWARIIQKENEQKALQAEEDLKGDEILKPVSEHNYTEEELIDYTPSPPIAIPKPYTPEIIDKEVGFTTVTSEGHRPLPVYNSYQNVIKPYFDLSNVNGRDCRSHDYVKVKVDKPPPRPLPTLETYPVADNKKHTPMENTRVDDETQKYEEQEYGGAVLDSSQKTKVN